MRYQKIESKIWHDEKFISLTPMQQRLFFYVLTCPHNNLTGLFVLKPGYACEDLKYLPKDFEKDLKKLIEKGLIEYDFENSVLLIINFLKHNPITNPNQKKAVAAQLVALPKSLLIKRFLEINPTLVEVLPKGLKKALPKPEEDSDSDSDSEKDPDSEKRHSPPEPPVPAPPLFKIQDLARLWNLTAPPELSKVHLPYSRPEKDMKRARDSLKRHPERDWWKMVIQRMHYSQFLRGENDRRWKANFDFLISKAEEILDGKYDNAQKQPKGWQALKESIERRKRRNAE
jgi:hypothetical protein